MPLFYFSSCYFGSCFSISNNQDFDISLRRLSLLKQTTLQSLSTLYLARGKVVVYLGNPSIIISPFATFFVFLSTDI